MFLHIGLNKKMIVDFFSIVIVLNSLTRLSKMDEIIYYRIIHYEKMKTNISPNIKYNESTLTRFNGNKVFSEKGAKECLCCAAYCSSDAELNEGQGLMYEFVYPNSTGYLECLECFPNTSSKEKCDYVIHKFDGNQCEQILIKNIIISCCSICGEYIYGCNNKIICASKEHKKVRDDDNHNKMRIFSEKYIEQLLDLRSNYSLSSKESNYRPRMDTLNVFVFHLETNFFFIYNPVFIKLISEYVDWPKREKGRGSCQKVEPFFYDNTTFIWISSKMHNYFLNNNDHFDHFDNF